MLFLARLKSSGAGHRITLPSLLQKSMRCPAVDMRRSFNTLNVLKHPVIIPSLQKMTEPDPAQSRFFSDP